MQLMMILVQESHLEKILILMELIILPFGLNTIHLAELLTEMATK